MLNTYVAQILMSWPGQKQIRRMKPLNMLIACWHWGLHQLSKKLPAFPQFWGTWVHSDSCTSEGKSVPGFCCKASRSLQEIRISSSSCPGLVLVLSFHYVFQGGTQRSIKTDTQLLIVQEKNHCNIPSQQIFFKSTWFCKRLCAPVFTTEPKEDAWSYLLGWIICSLFKQPSAMPRSQVLCTTALMGEYHAKSSATFHVFYWRSCQKTLDGINPFQHSLSLAHSFSVSL